MAYLRGISVIYQYPTNINFTIHAERQTELSEEIPMDIIFDENPKVSTLKKIHWVSELPDDKPYIAYLPFDAPHLSVECVITIPPIDVLHEKARKFKVTSLTALMEYPDAYVCTLAPIVDTENPKLNYDSSNYNHLVTKDIPNTDTPLEENNREYDDYYGYLKV